LTYTLTYLVNKSDNMNRKKNHVRRKQTHHISAGKRRAKNKSSDGNASTSSSGGDMDDIMAQLQLQRERQKQKKKDDTADVLAAAKVKEDNKPKERDAAPSIKQEIGDFRFDPISNRYLPKSSFNKSDRKEAKKQAKIVSIDRLRWGKRDSISDEDVSRVLFRGSALDHSRTLPNKHAQKKKAKKQHGDNESCSEQQCDPQQHIPCSERVVQLLTTSLQYANSHKRNAIVNILGPIAMARGATVVPSTVTDDMLSSYTKTRRSDQQPLTTEMQQHTSRKSRELSSSKPVPRPVPKEIQRRKKSTKSPTRKSPMGERWHSLLHPIIQSGMSLGTPYDCICKTFLPPTASTFDIQPHPNSIPSVVTIAGEELFCRQKYSLPPGGRKAFQLANPPDNNAWNLSVLDHVDTTCQSVKFSPCANQIGILAHDSSLQYCFAFKNFDSKSTSLTHIVRLDDVQVNDFCFSPNGETVCYRVLFDIFPVLSSHLNHNVLCCIE